jgi:hypothetical protein
MRTREIQLDCMRIILGEYFTYYIIWYDGDVDFGTYGLAHRGVSLNLSPVGAYTIEHFVDQSRLCVNADGS